ncbi:ArsR/SmtB family transcription factor [Gymnodinialimonas hymeniacidonis]|uniref:ArsR/SmtB family transcription factor n=1 Tax=Gymnodinialimonas hymeniacidonis TaxID=3126508 RepID=UPI0034C61C10
MVERSDDTSLTRILKAASDPTRRAILTLLAQQGPLTISVIQNQFPMSLNAISKHIKVLEGAGLVSRRTEWREHYIELKPEVLAEVDQWFTQLRSIWDQRLDALDQIITKGAAK